MPVSFRPRFKPLLAIAAVVTIAVTACTVPTEAPKPVPQAPAAPPAPPPSAVAEQPSFFRLPNLPAGQTPIRVGIILPFSHSDAGARNLASAMMKAAELALFDSTNREILLMTADEGTPVCAMAEARCAAPGLAQATSKLIDQGAEILVGPLFAPSVAAVGAIARTHDIPVLAFSTESRVAGNGVYLMGFLPQVEVRRVVSYAAQQGHTHLTALVPESDYGNVVAGAFTDAVHGIDGATGSVERFPPNAGAVIGPVDDAAKMGADAILIAQGGTILRAITPTLAFDGVDTTKVKLLGTGLWDDPSLLKEQTLAGGWFAAPPPNADAAFNAKYQAAFGGAPPTLASLAYDAISLVALLAPGTPFQRFTSQALMDPNGFSGVDGIFRFDADGTADRGLAILQVTPDGFTVVNPAPTTFQNDGASSAAPRSRG